MKNQLHEGQQLLKQYQDRLNELREVDDFDPEKIALRTAKFYLDNVVKHLEAFREMYPPTNKRE